MSDRRVDDLLESIRPEVNPNWTESDVGQTVLARVDTVRTAPQRDGRGLRSLFDWMTPPRWIAVGGLATATALALVVGGALMNRDGLHEPDATGTQQPRAAATIPPADLDSKSLFQPPVGAQEAQHYTSLSQAVRDRRNITVAAFPVGGTISRRIEDPEAHESSPMVALTFQITKTLAGTSSLTAGDTFPLEFMASPDTGLSDSQLVSAYLEFFRKLGPAVAIITNKQGSESAYYRLACSQTLFVARGEHVYSAYYQTGKDPLAKEAETYKSLTALGSFLSGVE